MPCLRQSIHHDYKHYTNYSCGDKSCYHLFFVAKHTSVDPASHVNPMFQNFSLQLMPALNFDSDEWHKDETVVKINGVKHYIWFIIDSETRFILGYHLLSHCDSPQAFSLMESAKTLDKPGSIVSDRYSAYKIHIR